jgi:hypothetical protein
MERPQYGDYIYRKPMTRKKNIELSAWEAHLTSTNELQQENHVESLQKLSH